MLRLSLFMLLLSLASWCATAQSGGGGSCTAAVQLTAAEVDRAAGVLELEVLARDADCQPIGDLRPEDLRIAERVGEGPEREVAVRAVRFSPRYDTVDLRTAPFEVLFLVDIGQGSNPGVAARLIEQFVRLQDTMGISYRLLPFAATPGEEIGLSASRLVERVGALRPGSRPAHLHGAVVDAARRLQDREGRQLVVLISSGTNVPPDYGNLPRLPPGEREVYEAVSRLPDLYLFTVATQEQGADLLQELPRHTVSPQDDYAIGRLPPGLTALFGRDRQLIASHVLEVATAVPEFRGLERQYTLTDRQRPAAPSTSVSLRSGSYNDRFVLGARQDSAAWVPPTLVGLAGVAGLLAAFFFLVPVVRRQQFERQHVVPYTPQPGRQVLDPLTREPIPAGEEVVNVCAQVVPLRTWRDCGDQCPHYPGCTSNTLQCAGAGQGANPNFFALQGDNRRLNWIWFGAVGGLVGWILYALVAGLLPGFATAGTLVRDGLLGACFGTGLTLMLAVMEERSQSRRISPGRILLRTVLGALVATATFGGSYLLLEYNVLRAPVLAAAIAWLLFGLGLGIVLTVRSTIDERRGLLGGLLAGIVGFVVYWVIGELAGTDRIAKVVSLLVSGALLGLVLDTVVQLAEAYEMEYIAPANYQRRVPLSKWLRNGWDIVIGTQPGSQVYVKWPDEDVLPEHAQLRMDGGRVYLLPQGETLVNGRIVNGQKRTQLQNGDTIQLGRRGHTQMRFWAEATQ